MRRPRDKPDPPTTDFLTVDYDQMVPHADTHKLHTLTTSLPQAIRFILTATRTHATNLAKFVTLYKVLLLLQKRMNGGKERDLDSLIAGGLGGWWVFGERNAVSAIVP